MPSRPRNRILRVDDTPNPNAFKCVLAAPPPPHGDRPRGYQSLRHAQDDPLGAKIMAIPGVVNVLIVDDWISVGKAQGAAWAEIRKALDAVLAEAG